MPSASYLPPTMKPEMFWRNSKGVRRWQASSMKWAPFTALSLNSTPLLARIATGMPQICAKPQTRVDAVERLELVELAAVDEAGDHLVNVIGRAHVLGDDAVELLAIVFRRARIEQRRRPARRSAVAGSRRCRARWSAHARHSRRDDRPRPSDAAWSSPPPRSSALISSPVAAFTSGGPARKIVPWLRTMTLSSDIAGT